MRDRREDTLSNRRGGVSKRSTNYNDRLEFEKKRRARLRRNNKRFFTIFSISLLLLLLTFTTTFLKQKRKIQEYRVKNEEISNKIKDLTSEIENLNKDLKAVNSDEFIEKYAREKLGMVKKTDLIYEINKDKKNKDGDKKNNN